MSDENSSALGASTTREMPKYKCHKEVYALKIESVELDSHVASKEGRETDGSALLHFEEEEGFEAIKVDHSFVKKHSPQGGGYYVVYEDGYKSWSPADAFESGYSLME